MNQPPTNEPPILALLVCEKCGASNSPHATRCWLCDGSSSNNPFSPPALSAVSQSGDFSAGSESNQRVQAVFLVLLIGIALLAVLIGIGISLQDQGLLIPYVIFVGPAFLATGSHALINAARRRPNKASSLLLTFLFSALLSVVAMVMLVLAGIIALLIWCAQMLPAPR